jgi:hypothetical protein
MLFQSLFHVKIYNCNDIVSLQGLKTVPVVELISLQNLTDISNLGGNKVVEINDCQVISAFSSLKNVPKVFICDCTSFTNGCDVENVRYLKITYCDNFANPDALENVFDLTVANNAVEDLQGLCNIPYLDVATSSTFALIPLIRSLGSENQRFSFPYSCYAVVKHVVDNSHYDVVYELRDERGYSKPFFFTPKVILLKKKLN